MVVALTSMPAEAQRRRSQPDNSPFAGFSGNSNEPVNITSQVIELHQREQKAIFSGRVVARQGTSTLRAPTVTVFYDNNSERGASPTGAVKRIVATGGVLITSDDQKARGSRGVFDMVKNRAYLYGNVVLTQGENVVRGKQLTVDLKTGLAVVSGGAEARLVQSDELRSNTTGRNRRRSN